MESGAGTGSAGGPPPQDINNTCPLTIHVKLVRQDVAADTSLVLDGNSLRLAADGSTEVASVTSQVMKTLQTCLGMGISYPKIRVVIDKQGVRYAEFSQ